METFYQKIPISGYIAALMLLFAACEPRPNNVYIEGTTDFAGSSEWFLEKKPVHYKYAPKIRFPLTPDSNGNFSKRVPIDSAQVIWLNIGDHSFPLWAMPGKALQLQIDRGLFPTDVKVSGYPAEWNVQLNKYLQYEQDWQTRISDLRRSFLDGEDDRLIGLYRERYRRAGELLEDTPFIALRDKAVGEYLVKRLEWLYRLRKNDRSGSVDFPHYRNRVISEAQKLNFFTFKSLWAQRAGIRDFAHAWANTFGVEKRLEQQYDQELVKYDVQRLAYETLDSARVALLDYIDEPKALAYARMHLIAERMTSMSLEVADDSYTEFIRQYENVYPPFAEFLKNLYADMLRVAPGQPAIGFELPDPNGNIHRLDNYRGKYVLLDFWASWCLPCLNEFPHMKELYEEYDQQNFEIVGISIEEDSLRWRSALDRLKLPWVQLYAGDGFDGPLWNKWQGGGIPFYVLIGPDGKILRYNDVRPSFNLPNLLDSLTNRQTADEQPTRNPENLR